MKSVLKDQRVCGLYKGQKMTLANCQMITKQYYDVTCHIGLVSMTDKSQQSDFPFDNSILNFKPLILHLLKHLYFDPESVTFKTLASHQTALIWGLNWSISKADVLQQYPIKCICVLSLHTLSWLVIDWELYIRVNPLLWDKIIGKNDWLQVQTGVHSYDLNVRKVKKYLPPNE